MRLPARTCAGVAAVALAIPGCGRARRSAAPPPATLAVPTAKPPPPPAHRVAKPATDLSLPARLVADLEAAQSIPARDARWAKEKALVVRLRRLADPRAADALAGYLSRHPDWKRSGERVHFQTEAAVALAELGDLRALPVLAARLRLDPRQVYVDDGGPEAMLRRDDEERVVAARLIADMATLHPEALGKVRAVAEQPVFQWITSLPSPHDGGMRALAAMQTHNPAILERLRAWANPQDPLPKPGAQPPFPEAWVIAQSALRYVGALHDKESWPILLEQLKRRPATLDTRMAALMTNGTAILGMSLRALGMGAARGLSAWGDAKAFDPLLRYIDTDKENEQSRRVACSALAWVMTRHDVPRLAKLVAKLSRSRTKADRFKLQCTLVGLQERRVAGLVPALLHLMTAKVPDRTRHAVARALGKPGLDAAAQHKVERLLDDPKLRDDAALALLLGGSRDAARHAVSALPVAEVTDSLGDLYLQSFGYFADADLARGHLYRWVDNALALEGLDRPKGVQKFARNILAHQFGNLLYDNGPHSLTRIVLRRRLFDAARSGPTTTRLEAVSTLELMHERGTLLALADGKGRAAERAAKALDRLPDASRR